MLGEKLGGVGAGLPAADALKVGLKVDSGKLPAILVESIKQGSVNLASPETTLALLKADAVVGVRAFVDENSKKVTGIGHALRASAIRRSTTRWPRGSDAGSTAGRTAT